MTEEQLYAYFCKNARYYDESRLEPYYAVRPPGQSRFLRDTDTERLFNAMCKAYQATKDGAA